MPASQNGLLSPSRDVDARGAVQLLGQQLLKFLQAQNQMAAPAWLSVAAVIVNIGLNFLFIRHYGFLGAPLATTLSRLLLLVAAAGLVAVSLRRAAWRPASAPTKPAPGKGEALLQAPECAACAGEQPVIPTEPAKADEHLGGLQQLVVGAGAALEDGRGREGVREGVGRAVRQGLSGPAIGSYLRLALPGGAMVALEASSFDVTTAFAGMLGVVQVGLVRVFRRAAAVAACMRVVRPVHDGNRGTARASMQVDAHVAMLTAISFNFLSFPFGIAVAATIRVGNLLGADRPVAARAAGWCAVALGAAPMAVCAVAIAAARGRLARIFIDDAAVQRALSSVALFGAAAEVFDGIMGTAQVPPSPPQSARVTTGCMLSCQAWHAPPLGICHASTGRVTAQHRLTPLPVYGECLHCVCSMREACIVGLCSPYREPSQPCDNGKQMMSR